MKKSSLFIAVSALTLISAGGMAHAAQMDYGALESLFGEAVTTSATGSPQRASEAPVNMEIITSDDIRRTGARTVPEALKGVVGLDVMQSGVNDFDVGIRGHNDYYNPRVLVMVNGRQVYLDTYGYTSWATLPVAMNEIRQIEVVKGPNTALFGFNAVAGVINIITWNPSFDNKSNATVTAGSGPDYSASVMKTFKIGEQSGLRLSTSGRTSGEFGEHGNKVAADQDVQDAKNRTLNFDGRFLVAPRTTLSVGGSHVVASADELSPVLVYSRGNYETNSASLGLSRETEKLGTIDFSIYHNVADLEFHGGGLAGQDYNNEVTVAKLEDLFKIGTKHTFRVAGEYRHNWEDGLRETGDYSYDVFSTSAMWNWQISDSTAWTNALRADKMLLDRNGSFLAANPFTNQDYNTSLTAYSANSGLVYKATPSDTIGLSYARGIQVPSLIQYGAYEITSGPVYVGGTPNLNPTIATTIEASVTHKMPELDVCNSKVNGTLKAALFRNHYADIISVPRFGNPTISPAKYLFENAGNSSATGIELSAKGTMDANWRWGLNYTLEGVQDNADKNGSGTDRYAFGNENALARQIFNASLGYNSGKWESDLNAHLVSGRDLARDDSPAVPLTNSIYKIDAVYGLSARVGYKLTDGLTLSVNGSNLQAAHSEQTSGHDVERSVWAGLSFDF